MNILRHVKRKSVFVIWREGHLTYGILTLHIYINNKKHKVTVERAIFHQPNIRVMVKTLQEAFTRAEWSVST